MSANTREVALREDQAPAAQSHEQHVIELAKKEEAGIMARVMVAQKVPRDEVVAMEKMHALASRKNMAKDAFYSFRRAGRPIEDVSVYLARPLAALWGNMTHGFRILLDDGEQIKVGGYAWDMQTNTLVEQEASFANLIYRKKEGWIKPDERDKRELINRHGAIVIRNCILQVIPKDIIEDIKATVRKTLTADLKNDVRQARINAVRSFKEIGISAEKVAAYLSRQRGEPTKIEDATPEELRELFGIYNSIKDGNSKWSEYIQDETTEERHSDSKDGNNGTLNMSQASAGNPEDHQDIKAPVGGSDSTESDTSPSGEPLSNDRDTLRQRLLQLSAEKTPKVSPANKKLLAAIGESLTDMTVPELQKAVRAVEEMEIIEKPKRAIQEPINLD